MGGARGAPVSVGWGARCAALATQSSLTSTERSTQPCHRRHRVQHSPNTGDHTRPPPPARYQIGIQWIGSPCGPSSVNSVLLRCTFLVSGRQFASSAYLSRNCASSIWHVGGLHSIVLKIRTFYLGKKVCTFDLEKYYALLILVGKYVLLTPTEVYVLFYDPAKKYALLVLAKKYALWSR
jgi:hypothetical protein